VWAEGSKPCIFLPDDLRNPHGKSPRRLRTAGLDSFQSRWLDDDNRRSSRTISNVSK
jgi:hypothetical protein